MAVTRRARPRRAATGAAPSPPSEARAAAADRVLGGLPTRIMLAALVALSAILRLRLATMPLERDEGEYAYFGQLILRGEWPYVAAHHMKLPGTYYAYAAIMGLLGETDVAIRIGLVLINAATIVLVFALARRLAGDVAALTAAAAFAMASLGSAVVGFTANAEHFVLLPALAGLLLLTRDAPSLPRVLAAGVLLGIGFVMKQPGLAFAGCGAAWLALDPAPISRRAVAILVLAIGAALPHALLCLAMLAGGAFDAFWFWTVTYLREYGTMIDVPTGLGELRLQLSILLPAAPLTWLLAAAGLAALATPTLALRTRLRLLLLLAASAAAVVPGLRFTDHYFVLLLPALALLAGVGVDALARRSAAWRADAPRAVALAAPALIVVLALLHDRDTWLVRTPNENARALYGVNPLAEAVEIGRELDRRAAPDDRIAVIGSEPQIYFYARRRGATGYLYMYPLMEPHPFAHAMQDEMIAQLERAEPRFLVLVNVDTSWSRRPDSSLKILDWAARTVDERYRPIGLVEMTPDGPSRSVWGDAAATATPTSRAYVAVFERTS